MEFKVGMKVRALVDRPWGANLSMGEVCTIHSIKDGWQGIFLKKGIEWALSNGNEGFLEVVEDAPQCEGFVSPQAELMTYDEWLRRSRRGKQIDRVELAREIFIASAACDLSAPDAKAAFRWADEFIAESMDG